MATAVGAYSVARGAAASAFGVGALANGNGSTAVGRQSAAMGTYAQSFGSMASAVGNSSNAIGQSATALGSQSIAIGSSDISGYSTTASTLLYRPFESAQALGDRSIAFGSGATTGTTQQSVTTGQIINKTWSGVVTAVDASTGAVTTSSGQYGNDAVAIGHYAKARNDSATALGLHAEADGMYSMALGDNTDAAGYKSIAIGSGAKTTTATTPAIDAAMGHYAAAIGANSQATGFESLALAYGSNASGSNSIAGGNTATASADNTIALGKASAASNSDAIAMGNTAAASGTESIAMGHTSKAQGASSMAFGDTANASNTNAIAIGTTAQATSTDTTAIGTSAKATYKNAIAAGTQATASSANTAAIGAGSLANATNAYASGVNAQATAAGAVATGYAAKATGVQAVAIGGSSTDGGTDSAQATGANSVAIGTNAIASGEKSISIGTKNKVVGKSAGVIGDPTDNYGDGTYVVGNDDGSDATGNAIQATESSIIGNNNVTATTGTTDIHILGNSNTVSTNDVGVVGSNNTVSTANTYILGDNVTTTAADSVILGSKSGYTAEGTTTKGLSTTYTGDTINGTSYTYAGGDTNVGVVSVGATGTTNETRRIQNVAPGYIAATSTDAINGSQLYAVTQELDKGINIATAQTGTGTTNTTMTATDSAGNKVDNISLGETLKYTAGNNVSIDQTANNLTISAKNAAVTAGSNTHVQSAEDTSTGVTTYTVSSDKSTVSAATPATDGFGVTVTPTTSTDATTGAITTNYAVDLNDATKQQITNNTTNIANNSTKIQNNADAIAKGWNITTAADGGTANTPSKTKVAMGDTVTIKAGKNIVTTQDGQNITIATADNVVTTDTDKYVTGGSATKATDTSNTVTGTLTMKDGSTESFTGLENTYVTSASTSTDGKTVTLTRNDSGTVPIDLTNTVKAASTEVQAGNNVKVVKSTSTDADGHTIYTVNANKTTVSSDGTVSVTPTTDADGNTNYKLAVDLSSVGSMSGFNVDANNSGSATKISDTNTVNFNNGTNTTATKTAKADGTGVDVVYDINSDLKNITSISNTTNGPTIKLGDTTNTVDFGGATITNVTPGTNSSDVATVGQLSKVAAGTNVASVTSSQDDTTKATTYTVNANGTTASAGSGAVTVTAGTKDTNNVTDYKIDLSDATKTTLNQVATNTTNITKNASDIDKLQAGFNIAANGTTSNITLGGNTVPTITYASGNDNATVDLDSANNTVTYTVDTANVIKNINSATTTPITNISAAFGVTAESGDQKNVTLAQNTTPTVKFVGDGSLITSETNADGVKYSINQDAMNTFINNNSTVQAAKTEVQAGNNVTVAKSTSTDADGHTIYTVNGKDTTVSSSNNTVKVTTNRDSATGITNYDLAVDLSGTGSMSGFKVDANNSGSTTNIGDTNTVNFNNGTNTTATKTAKADGTGVDVVYDLNKDVTGLTSITMNGDTNITNPTTITGDTINTTNVNASNMTVTNAPTSDTSVTNKKYVDDGRTQVTGTNLANVTKKSADGVSPAVYNVDVNATDIANATPLTYKASTADGTDGTANTVTLAKGLDFTSTDNITMATAADGVVTATLNSDLKNITTISNTTNGGPTITLGDTTNTVNVGGAQINNMGSGAVNNEYTNLTNGANIGDVINIVNASGWTVQGNSTDVTDINNGDKVNFVNGTATTATVTNDTATNTATVKYNVNVDGSTIKVNNDGNLYVDTTAVSNDTVTEVKSADGSVTVTNTTPDKVGNTAYNLAVTKGSITTDSTGKSTAGAAAGSTINNSFATVNDVTNAINNSGWNVTTSGNATGTTTELINPSETVTIDGGKNIQLTQTGNKISIATSDTPTFTNVTVTNMGNTDNSVTTKKYVDDGRTQVTGTNLAKVTKKSADGVSPAVYNVDVNATDIANATPLTYKASTVDGTDGTANTVTLAKGLDFTSTNNITMAIATDGVVTATLNSDLKNITSITNGDTNITLGSTTVNNVTQPIINVNNARITNVAPGTDGTDAVNVNQLNAAKTEVVQGTNTTVTSTTATDGHIIYKVNADLSGAGTMNSFNVAQGGTQVNSIADGNIVNFVDGKNTTAQVTKTDTGVDVTYNVADNVVLGKDGKDGSIGVNGADGVSGVAINGKDGSIGLTGSDGKTITITGKDGANGLDGQPVDRIVVNNTEVATMNDGLNFTGNNSDTINAHKLNTLVNIVGEGTKAGADATKVYNANGTEFTSAAGNVAVVADGNSTLMVKLNKDLQNINSISNTNTDGSTTKITLGGDTNTINMGGAQITNVAAGSNTTDVATVGQLTTVQSSDGTIKVTDNGTNAGHKYDISVNAQGLVNNTQMPVVYTTKDGIQVYKQADGTFNTKKDGSGTTVAAGDIIASMNNADNTTTNPTQLGNVGSSISTQDGNTFLDKLDNANTNNPNNAVNVSDLKNTADGLSGKGLNFTANSNYQGNPVHKNLGDTMNIIGGGTKADSNYSAENIKTMTDVDGNLLIALDKDLKANTVTVGAKDGEDGTPGVDGTIGVNGRDGSSVVINGKDGSIGLTGPKGADGTNGSSATITVKPGYDTGDTDAIPGQSGANGVDGKDGITRIVYTDNQGEHQVATMEDGIKYTGDSGSAAIKLNQTTNVVGGADTTNLTTGNIGVVASQEGDNAKLTVELAKDLTGLNSVTTEDANGNKNVMNATGNTITDNAGNINSSTATGNTITNQAGDKTEITAGNVTTTNAAGNSTTVNSNGVTINNSVANPNKTVSLTNNGLDNGGNKIVNVAPGEISATSTDAVNGSQLYATNQNITNITDKVNKGLNFAGNTGNVNKQLGDTMNIVGEGTKADSNYDGQNIKTMVNASGDLVVKMDKDIKTDSVTTNNVTVGGPGADGQPGKDGQIGVRGADGKAGVTIDGANGTVKLENGKDGADGASANIGVVQGKPGVNGADGTTMTRIEYKDDKNQPHQVATLDDGIKYTADQGNGAKIQLNQITNITGGNKGELTDNNIGVVANQNTNGKDAEIQIKLAKDITGLNSIESTTVKATTVKAGDTTINSDGLTINNGPSITKTGIDAGNKTITNVAPGVNGTDAVNVNQLDAATGWSLVTDSGDSAKSRVDRTNNTFTIKGDGNIKVTNNGNTANVKLNNTLFVGGNVNDEHHHPVVIDGTSGQIGNLSNTTLTPQTGKNGRESIAATEGQLRQMGDNIQGGLNRLDGRIDEVGANAAAMAGLKPIQYDPLEPTQVMAAVGGYHGEQAAALGIAHYTQEDTMIHAGVSIGTGETMYNVGYTHKFGGSPEKKAIPDRYKAGPISSVYVMEDEVTALKQENAKMKAHDEQLTADYNSLKADNEETKAKLAMLMQKLGM